jgi:hypothetical protein
MCWPGIYPPLLWLVFWPVLRAVWTVVPADRATMARAVAVDVRARMARASAVPSDERSILLSMVDLGDREVVDDDRGWGFGVDCGMAGHAPFDQAGWRLVRRLR